MVPQWCSAPSSAGDTSSSLEGGEDGGDDDDNIAYSAVVVSHSLGVLSRKPYAVWKHVLGFCVIWDLRFPCIV